VVDVHAVAVILTGGFVSITGEIAFGAVGDCAKDVDVDGNEQEEAPEEVFGTEFSCTACLTLCGGG